MGRPAARLPSWHEAQAPTTCAWSTRCTGDQPPKVWQDSQRSDVGRCCGLRPVARPPSWQLTQLPVTPAWSNFAGAQARLPWQALQSMFVWTWPAGLPGACTPLWQLAQLPFTWSWSKRTAGIQAAVEWQATHASPLTMCVAGLGVAPTRAPGEWHEKQSRGVPLKTAFTWQDSQACIRCAPVSSKPVVRWSNCRPATCADAPGSARLQRSTRTMAASLRMVWCLTASGRP